MKPLYKALVAVIPAMLLFYSCSKEGSNDGGGDCNSSTVMRLKKWVATYDPEHYIEATWNGDGTINTLKVNVPLSYYSTAKFFYASGKIKEAVLYDNSGNTAYDTVVFRYNGEGKVDSLYRKVSSGFGLRLTYANGKLTKITRHDGPASIMYYYDVVMDASGNITKAEEYWNEGSSFEKQSTFTFTRDTKKNPLADLGPALMYLNDEYEAFWYWGPNNMTDQRYQDHTGTGADVTSGYKFKYNNNCYPSSAQNTIMGQPVFQDDDFTFTYY
jgi:hypothetical protein